MQGTAVTVLAAVFVLGKLKVWLTLVLLFSYDQRSAVVGVLVHPHVYSPPEAVT